MSIKIIFFPFAIIVMLYLSIGHIWPDVARVSEKRDAIEKKKEELRTVKERRTNLDALVASLKTKTDDKNFVFDHLPQQRNEERLVNDANRLIEQNQASLFTIDFDVTRSSRRTTAQDEDVVPVEYVRYTVTATGTYEQLRSFLAQWHSIGRVKKVSQVSLNKIVETSDQETPADQPVSPQSLRAEIVYDYGYLLPVKNTNLQHALLRADEFNWSPVTQIRATPATTVEGINIGPSSRSNPFLP